MKHPGFVKPFWLFVLACLILAGCGFVIISALPFDTAKSLANGLAKDGNLESFTVAVYAKLSVLKWIGLTLLGISSAISLAREKSQQIAARFLLALGRAKDTISGDIRNIGSAVRTLGGEKWHLYLLAAILVLAIANTAMFLSRPMRYDEAYTFNIFASKHLIRVISDYSLPNNHIFHSIVLHFAYRILGNHPWVLRLPAFVAGMLLVPAGYLAARTQFNADTALLGASLIAFFSILVYYSTNARGYTIIALITLLLITLGAYVKTHTNRTAWILMAVLSSIGFYTVPVMLYPFGSLCLWLLLAWIIKDTSNTYSGTFLKYLFLFGVLTMVLVVILYVPVFVAGGIHEFFHNCFVRPLEGPQFWHKLFRRLGETWTNLNKGVPPFLMAVLIFGLGHAMIFRRKLTRHRVSFLAVMLMFVGGLVIYQRVAPFDRMYLFSVPIFLIWAAAGLVFVYENTIARLAKQWPAVQIAVKTGLWVLISASLMWSGSQFQRQRSSAEAFGETIAIFLQDNLAPDDVIVTTFPNDAPIRYYFGLYDTNAGQAFSYDSEAFRKAIVIVNQSEGQTLESVLEKQKFPLELLDMESVSVFCRYKHLILYRVERQ